MSDRQRQRDWRRRSDRHSYIGDKLTRSAIISPSSNPKRINSMPFLLLSPHCHLSHCMSHQNNSFHHSQLLFTVGMFYLLLICILAFTDAVCIIKYRMPCEESHHPFIKCSQQQLYEQAESLPVPLPPHLIHHPHPSSSSSSAGHHHHHTPVQAPMITSPSSPLPPPPPLNSHCYAPKTDPQFHAV